MTSLYLITRWVHILSGAAWFGLVAAVVFVIFPSLSRMEDEERKKLLPEIFPRIFRLASVLAGMALAAGALLNYQLTGWRNLGMYFSTPRWTALFIGGLLGLVLGIFHFILEPKLEKRIQLLAEINDPAESLKVARYLKFIPRFGLGILLIVILTMMIFARGAG